MEKSVCSTIEKIKREEQNKEAKLKAKRELEAAKAATERSFRDTVSQIKKSLQEKEELIKKTDKLRAQLTIQKIRRDVLAAQLLASKKELRELLSKVDQANSEILDLRSMYCKTVQDVSEECDVWALLTKPSTETIPRPMRKPMEKSNENLLGNENRLKIAKERRERAIAEREHLQSEPDTGEEFLRASYKIWDLTSFLPKWRKVA